MEGDAVLVSTADGTQKPQLQRFLDTNGDGTGTTNAIGNYAAAPTPFFCQPPQGVIFRVSRLLVAIEDGNGMMWQQYGNIGAVANGVRVRTLGDNGTIEELTDVRPAKSNAGWGDHCYDVEIKGAGGGNDFCQARWSFFKSGQLLRLVGDRNERFEVLLNDNFGGLIGHHFKINGYIEHGG